MANYGLKYKTAFDSTAAVTTTYVIEIEEKNYNGIFYPMTLAATPVIHTWDNDSIEPGIYGSSIKLAYLHDGTLPLINFYSEEDDKYRIKLSCVQTGQILFIGFIVQADCSESMEDYLHQVFLSANDNLGLLKSVSLDENLPAMGLLATVKFDFISPIPDNFVYFYNTNFVPLLGVPFTITGHINPAANITLTPTLVSRIGDGNWKVQVADLSFFTDAIAWPCVMVGTGNIDLYKRNTILNIIRVCLFNTGLELETYILDSVFEETQDTSRCSFEQTYIDVRAFLNDTSFGKCWDVLDIICKTFELQIFQANGVWYIIRLSEYRYSSSADAYEYDKDFNFIGTRSIPNVLNAGYSQVTYPETAPLQSIVRPYKHTKKTFNYQATPQLLRNADLQNTGPLTVTYTTGSGTSLQTYYEYDNPPDFFRGTTFYPTSRFFIRIIKDYTGTEIERTLVVQGIDDQTRAILMQPFEVNAGDSVELSFTFKCNTGGAFGIIYFTMRLTDNLTSNVYANNGTSGVPQDWTNTGRWKYSASGATTDIQSVIINPILVPISGLIYVYFPQAVLSTTPTSETSFKDIRLKYTPYINDSTLIIGQVHTQEQPPVIKNILDGTVTIDDSPRNSILGTLFQPDFSSLIQNKTRNWYRVSTPTERRRLGEIMTLEQLFLNFKPRTKIEGNFYGLLQNGRILSKLMTLKYSAFPDPVFAPGRVEIDYRNNSVALTIFETHKDSEVETDLLNTYTFDYLYSVK